MSNMMFNEGTYTTIRIAQRLDVGFQPSAVGLEHPVYDVWVIDCK